MPCMFRFPNSDHFMFSREFAFCLFINYAYGGTWMHVHKTTFEKKINTVLWGSVTWSVMRKQNHNVKTSIIAELSRVHIISIKMSFSAASSLFCRHLQHLGKRSFSFSHSC